MAACTAQKPALESAATTAAIVTTGTTEDLANSTAEKVDLGVQGELRTEFVSLNEPGVGGRLTALAVDPTSPANVLAGGDLLGAARSTDGGVSWGPTFGLTNTEISSFAFQPTRSGEVWAATMGGPYRSLDGGLTWEPRRVGMPPLSEGSYTSPVGKIIIDPARSDHLLAFGGNHREWEVPGQSPWGAVWETTDNGANWQRLSTVAGSVNVLDAAWLADGTVLVALLHGGVGRSTDSGRTWSSSRSGLPNGNARALATDPKNAAAVWLATGADDTNGKLTAGGVYRSTDGGRSWVSASKGLAQNVSNLGINNTARYYAITASNTSPPVLYTANIGWGAEALYRSTDGGLNWVNAVPEKGRPTPAYSTPVTAEALAIDPTTPDRVFAGNAEFVVRSTDGGKTWQDVSSKPVSAGSFSGTGYSGLVANRVRFDPARPGVIVLCAFDGANPLLSTDHGRSWRRPLTANYQWGGCTDVDVAASGRWYALLGQGNQFGGVAWFEPGSATWKVLSGSAVGLPEKGTVAGPIGSIAVLKGPAGTPSAPDVVVVTIADVAYRSSDGAATFQPLPAPGPVSEVLANPTQSGALYAAGKAGVYQTDATGDFALLPNSPRDATRLTIEPTGRLHVTVWRGYESGLFRLNSNGTWQRLTNESSAFEVAVDPKDSAHLLLATNDHPFHDVVTSVGVLESRDDGKTWLPFNKGLPMLRISAIAFDPQYTGRVILGTFGRGYYTNQRADP